MSSFPLCMRVGNIPGFQESHLKMLWHREYFAQYIENLMLMMSASILSRLWLTMLILLPPALREEQ